MSVGLPGRPACIAALDNSTVVIGYDELLPLQVWDVNTGTKLRETFEPGRDVTVLVAVDGEKVVVGWRPNVRPSVQVFNMRTCQRVQTVTGTGYIAADRQSIGVAEGRILVANFRVDVWDRDDPVNGLYQHTASHLTRSGPAKRLTVLGKSTVAVFCGAYSEEPVKIELWDWKIGCLLYILGDLDPAGGSSTPFVGISRLSEGLLVTASGGGALRIGTADNWSSSTLIQHGSELLSILGGDDSDFVTADANGDVTFWRNGAPVGAVAGCNAALLGILASVGETLAVIGAASNMLVFR